MSTSPATQSTANISVLDLSDAQLLAEWATIVEGQERRAMNLACEICRRGLNWAEEIG